MADGAPYLSDPITDHYIFSPWYAGAYKQLYDRLKPSTFDPIRGYHLQKFSAACAQSLDGHIAECGVYRGNTAYLIADAVKGLIGERKLLLFDTFKGMPENIVPARDYYHKGDFGDTRLEEVQLLLRDFPFVEFHPGLIPETFKTLPERRYCFVHIDVDIYEATRDACAYFYERLLPGGIILFDEYGFHAFKDAEKKAADEFFADKPEPIIPLLEGTAIVIKSHTPH